MSTFGSEYDDLYSEDEIDLPPPKEYPWSVIMAAIVQGFLGVSSIYLGLLIGSEKGYIYLFYGLFCVFLTFLSLIPNEIYYRFIISEEILSSIVFFYLFLQGFLVAFVYPFKAVIIVSLLLLKESVNFYKMYQYK